MSYTYALPVVQTGPASPGGAFYAALPQVPNTSPTGNVMYVNSSPGMAAAALPPQPNGQLYIQQPQQQQQQYIAQQAQPQLMHQAAGHQAAVQYTPYVQGGHSPYVQGGHSPLLPMLPLSQQPSPQLAYQPLPVPQYAVHPLLGQPQNRSDIWEVFRPAGPILSKMYNAANLPATQPFQPEMRLVSADLPWTISVKAANGQYVTVGEVYEAIFNTLQGVVTHPEYRLTEPRTRKKMADQYQKRCTQYPLEHNEHARGIKRVDYLLHRNVFGGLKRDDKQAEELMMLNDQKMQYTWVLTLISR